VKLVRARFVFTSAVVDSPGPEQVAWGKTWQEPAIVSLLLLHPTFIAVIFLLIDIDDCVNHTCNNGGSCEDGVNSYSCSCPGGYTGYYCETGKLLFRQKLFPQYIA